MHRRLSQIMQSFRKLSSAVNRWPCRQCGHSVKMLEDICPECGTYGPLRMPCPAATGTAIACLMANYIVRFTDLFGR